MIFGVMSARRSDHYLYLFGAGSAVAGSFAEFSCPQISTTRLREDHHSQVDKIRHPLSCVSVHVVPILTFLSPIIADENWQTLMSRWRKASPTTAQASLRSKTPVSQLHASSQSLVSLGFDAPSSQSFTESSTSYSPVSCTVSLVGVLMMHSSVANFNSESSISLQHPSHPNIEVTSSDAALASTHQCSRPRAAHFARRRAHLPTLPRWSFLCRTRSRIRCRELTELSSVGLRLL